MRSRKKTEKQKIKDSPENKNNTNKDCNLEQDSNKNKGTGGLNKLKLVSSILLATITGYSVLPFIKDTLGSVHTKGQTSSPPAEFTPTFQRHINVSAITVDGRVVTPLQIHAGTVK